MLKLASETPGAGSIPGGGIDRHPERRMKSARCSLAPRLRGAPARHALSRATRLPAPQAWKAFEERETPKLMEEFPGLRQSQLKVRPCGARCARVRASFA